jgi:CO dehydrogenase maturation factor
MTKTLKIAVAGKGGVGKTLSAGVLAEYFAGKGFTVLAIDADPTPNLALTLGLSLEEANKIVPISENTPLIESKTQSSIPGVYNLGFTVEDIVEGTGCLCPANTIIRALLHHLIVKRKEAVITDMEAGLEHMGRGTAEHVETMLVVTDSSMKSLETAKKLCGLAKQIGIQECYIVGNRVASLQEGEHIEDFAKTNGLRTIGLVPFDEIIIKADMEGQTPLKYARESKAIKAIREIGQKLL